MARKQQNDPLRYAANLTALAAAVYLGVTALLRLAVGQLLRLFNKSATLENPIAVPEWVLGVFNVLLPAAGLAAAFWLLAVGVRATPMRLRISVQMPRDGRLWLFVPVFLGAGFLCSLLTTLLQRLLAGESCALVTDAGTPAISDPGEDLVALCAQHDIPVEAVPGPCALI